jgi:hypothetical protein
MKFKANFFKLFQSGLVLLVKIYRIITTNIAKSQRIVLILVVVGFMASFLRIYQLNLILHISPTFRLYYNVGSFLFQKDGVYNQYRTKRGQYTNNYITSLYEPQVKIGENIYSVYRPKAPEIKYKNQSYFFYTSETTAYLTRTLDQIPNYERNFLIGPSLNLYGQSNSIYNYSYQEFFKSYLNNVIDIDANCARYSVSKCENKFAKLNIRATAKNQDEFTFENNFYFQDSYVGIEKFPITAIVAPEDFWVCPDSNFDANKCFNPADDFKIDADQMPVQIIEYDGSRTTISLKDVGFSDFYVSNLKIADYYNTRVTPEVPMDKAKIYYLVHKSNLVYMTLTPHDNETIFDIQRQFGSIRITGKKCSSAICSVNFDVGIYGRPELPLNIPI